MSMKTTGAIGFAVLVAVIAGFLLFGGGDDAAATETDGAFVTEMAPHHESAVEMAQIALERAQHPEIEELATSIISTQEEEIGQLSSIHERLYGEPLEEGDHGTLGLPAEEMGMTMESSSLETAEPFDRAFIDMMVPHHQGAILMARIELEEGEDDEAKELANAIIEAQTDEIEQMNSWREEWYGAPSPAGGVPAPGETMARSHESGGH